MRNMIYVISVCAVVQLTACQTKVKKSDYNLDFEQVENGLPIGWETFGSPYYKSFLDSTISYSGRNSAIIESDGDSLSYRIWSYTIPNIYEGEKITLSGYMRTENVRDGHARVWMRLDVSTNEEGEREIDRITGTTDWTKYELTLDIDPNRPSHAIVGGILEGRGKMWMDNLSITVDGKNIRELRPLQFEKILKDSIYPAQTDRFSGSSSDIMFPDLDDHILDNLELLGRLWGFLKYYHPAIAKGNYNIDFELLRILPDYLKAKNDQERDRFLLRWIKKYGKIQKCKTCKEAPEDAILKPDFTWVDKSNMNVKLKNQINYIYRNRYQGEQYYVKMSAYQHPDFWHEKSYANMTYPDTAYRLIALYRFWNIIHYFFPYKYLCNKNWDEVLKEHLPRFISAKDELEYQKAALLLMSDTNDSHAIMKEGFTSIAIMRGTRRAPVQVRFVEGKLVVTDYYSSEYKEKGELKIGDIITQIDGKSVESIIDSIRPYYPASNESARLRDISRYILASNKKHIDIEYISTKKKNQSELNLFSIKDLDLYAGNNKNIDVPGYGFLNDSIGYIHIGLLKESEMGDAFIYLFKTKGIVVDMRNYPNSNVSPLASYFASKATPAYLCTASNIYNIGEIHRKGLMNNNPKAGLEEFYMGIVVVLVNEETQSGAESLTMLFKAGKNTIVVGSPTAGANGNVSTIVLPGGLSSLISMIGIYYPDGTETQRVGIVPDVIIRPTIEGIRNGRDEVLEKAIELITTN